MTPSDLPTPLEILRSSQLLDSLPDEDIADLAVSSRVACAKRGEIIWTCGSQVDFFGVIGHGFVKMVTTTAQGHDITTEIFGPGQAFGLIGALDGSGCPQMAKAVCETAYLRVRKQQMVAIYKGNIVLKDRMVFAGSGSVRRLLRALPRFAAGRVDERISSVLLMLAEAYGDVEGETVSIKVPLTRQDIAEMAGTTVESTIRTMSQWQKQGLVTTEKQHIHIVKPTKLQLICDGQS